MRTFSKVLASSIFFGSSTPSISTSAAFGPVQTNSAGQKFSISLFGNQGVMGGPQRIEFVRGFTMQANFGGNGNASSGTYGGLFNLLVSNVPETPMFIIAASALVNSTGSLMINSTQSNYNFIDFQFIPGSANSSSGFLSVNVTGKAGGS